MRENQATNYSIVEGGWGGHEATRVDQNLGVGGSEGVGGILESPGSPETHGVEGLPRRDKTSGVTPEGDGVTGRDRKGRGVDKNSPATQAAVGARTELG